MTSTKTTFNVFRIENRKSGREEWVGTVDADDAETAKIEADAQFDCPITCHLHVSEADSE